MELLKPSRTVVWILAGLCLATALSYVISRARSTQQAVSVEFEAKNEREGPGDHLLKLGAYNIAHGRGHVFGASNWDGGSLADKRERLEAIGTLLSSLDLDVVVLNEVDFSSIWSGYVDQASVIAESGGYPYIVRQRNIDVLLPLVPLRFGNAILSRHPVTQAEFVTFEPHSKWENVLLGNHDSVLAKITVPDMGSIAVLAVHLEYRNRGIRIQAATKIRDLAREVEEPFFAAGDFNSTYQPRPGTGPGKTAISLLLQDGQLFAFPQLDTLDVSHTFPAEDPDRVIDWILYPPEWRVISGGVMVSDLSDHLPVSVVLTQEPDSPSLAVNPVQ